MLRLVQQHFAETHNDAERIIEIVGDTARHSTKRSQTLLLDNLLLRALKFAQRSLELDRATPHTFLERRVSRLNDEV